MFDLDDWMDAFEIGALLLALGLLFALSGCGPRPTTIAVTASPAMTEATKDVIAAIDNAAGREIVTEGLGVWVVTSEATPEYCGYYEPGKSTITICPSCGEVRTILVHELGHAFGLEDSKDPDSIMFFRLRYGWTLDEAAASLVRELGADE